MKRNFVFTFKFEDGAWGQMTIHSNDLDEAKKTWENLMPEEARVIEIDLPRKF